MSLRPSQRSLVSAYVQPTDRKREKQPLEQRILRPCGCSSGSDRIGLRVKAFRQIGVRKAVRFIVGEFLLGFARHSFFPQLRAELFRLFGARIGKGAIIYPVSIMNFYRGSFKHVTVGLDCFVGKDVLLDLAGEIRFGDQVTLADRVSILTHLNVGNADHPLQQAFPAQVGSVEIGDGSFVGVGSILLCGARIGRGCFVAAGAVVGAEFPDNVLIGGVPAKVIRKLEQGEMLAKGERI